ncbi:MAG: ATP-binding cassette domain-containing protein [Chthoniobacterales bacterium]|nr:ATP-binding cassette domain-containing protein [Chthoniobacterales bacterium]
MPLLSFQNVGIRFGSRKVIDHFSAEIEEGEFIGIFGPNGVGKSTLMRAILGLCPIYEGSIQLFGENPGKQNRFIGYLPQSQSLLGTTTLTARALVAAVHHGEKWGVPWLSSKDSYQVERALELSEAKDYADTPFSLLSGGEKKRVMLAQALIDEPKLLILDEPLASLDPKNQMLLVQRIRNIQEETGLTILFIAHDVNPLLGAMSRVMYMAEGNVALGSAQEIITNESLSALYGMNIHVLRAEGRVFIVNAESNVDETTCSHV